MALTIRRQLVPDAIARQVTYAGRSRMVGITVHETGNSGVGANAAAHAGLQARGNSRSASWNWTVDDREAVQSFENHVRTWHAGSGQAGDGDDTIAIEICVNADGDYLMALANAAALVIHLRETEPTLGSGIWQHNHWSGKNCPTRLRSGEGGGWSGFLARVAGSVPAPAPAAPAAPAPVVRYAMGWTRLSFGSKGADVQALQRWLLAAGYSVGPDGADGSYGSDTRTAVELYQAAAGVEVDGKVGPDTQSAMAAGKGKRTAPAPVAAALKPAPAKSAAPAPAKRAPRYLPTLRQGARSTVVGIIQARVGAGRDNVWGAKTTAAVKAFQKANKLVDDGVVGPKTWTVMLVDSDLVLRQGDRGAAVEIWQYIIGVTVDGIFGPATEAATRELQRWLGVADDGKAGPATRTALGKVWK